MKCGLFRIMEKSTVTVLAITESLSSKWPNNTLKFKKRQIAMPKRNSQCLTNDLISLVWKRSLYQKNCDKLYFFYHLLLPVLNEKDKDKNNDSRLGSYLFLFLRMDVRPLNNPKTLLEEDGKAQLMETEIYASRPCRFRMGFLFYPTQIYSVSWYGFMRWFIVFWILSI